MATLIRSRWTSSFEGMSRRDRQGCDYDAYLPDPLAGWELALPADLVADLSDAEAAIRRLNATGTSHVSLEGLARFLLRAESVASSKIEGLEAGPRRLLDAEVVLAQGGDAADRIAVEVLANVAAMEAAVELGSSTDTITLDDLLGIHRTLMERSATPEIGGVVRTMQNWIGGSSYNPCSAAFVPPPPDTLDALLDDLLDVRQRRRPSCPRAGGDRPRPVRDDPPVRRRQRPHRARAHPCHPPPPRPRTALRPADQPRARHLGQRLHRRPHRVSTRRGA